MAHADSPIARARPDLWRPIAVDYPVAPDSPAAPGEAAKTSPKDVRAWARAEGVEVPARGPIPDEVVAAYQAAHAGDE